MAEIKRLEKIALNLVAPGFFVGCAVLIYGLFTCSTEISLISVLGAAIICCSLIAAAVVCYRDSN